MLRGLLDASKDGRSFCFAPCRSKDVRLQRQNGQAVIQCRGSLQIRDRLFEVTLLGIGDTLKRKRERGIWFQLQTLASEFDCVVVTSGEEQETGSDRVGSYRHRIEVNRPVNLFDRLVVPALCGEYAA